jgi:O-antigen ligase
VGTRGIARNNIPLIASIAVVFAALGDLLAYVNIGTLTGSAVFTAALAALCVISLPAVFESDRTRVLVPLLPFVVFALWQTVLVILLNTGVPGLQTIAVLWVFIGITAATAVFTSAASSERLRRQLMTAAIVLGTLYGIVVATGGIGAGGFIGRRSFALEALILIAAAVPFIGKRNRIYGFVTVFLVILVIASLSRTALVVAGGMYALRLCLAERGIRLVRLLALLTASLAGLWWAIENIPVIRDRFTGGDQALQLGDFTLSLQGRDRIWQTVIASAEESPWIGHGPGSAREVIGAVLTGQGEAHNDFLRTWHDSGWIGLILLSVALISLISASVRRARVAHSLSSRAPHIAALLALGAFLIGALTDNPIVYTFVMMPLALVVGMSMRTTPDSELGAAVARKAGNVPHVELR